MEEMLTAKFKLHGLQWQTIQRYASAGKVVCDHI